jgi:AcrR family transcriptional regulator
MRGDDVSGPTPPEAVPGLATVEPDGGRSGNGGDGPSARSGSGLRARVREQLRREMLDLARRQLGSTGASNLSLRGIARDLQMAPSAVHRYFAGRDDLLTALIIEGFDQVGDVAEAADATSDQQDHLQRWLDVTTAMRDWAVAHPHDYGLLYGSPVPGYRAPPGTVAPAMRDKIVLGRIVRDAAAAGRLHPRPAGRAAPRVSAEDVDRLRGAVLQGVPAAAVPAVVSAWAGLYGLLSLEVFGHLDAVILDRDSFFRSAMVAHGQTMGLAPEGSEGR